MLVALLVPVLLASLLPASASSASGDYLLMPRAELLSLPTSGTAWSSLKSTADGSWGSPNLCDKDTTHGVRALAGALVYARTSVSSYYTKTRNAIMSALGTQKDGCEDAVLSLGRQLGSYVLAADFIKLSGSDNSNFRSWLANIRTRQLGGHGRWKALTATHADSTNNWGSFAGASRIAASLYLGDTTDVAAAAKVVRGFMGDKAAWNNFRTPTSAELAWACSSTASSFTPINPACSRSGINLDGVIPSDGRRDGKGLTWPMGSSGIGYTLESLQGLILQAELLHRNGYGAAWSWSNSALRRTAGMITRNGQAGGPNWNRASANYNVPWLLNFRYNLKLPTRSAGYGRIFGYTDWLYGGRSGGVVATNPTPAPTSTANPTAAPTASPTAAPTANPTAGSVSLRSLSSTTVNSNAIVLERPSGTQAGDVLVAVIDMRGNTSTSIGAPTGWTFVRRDGYENALNKAIYVRTAAASEPSSYRFAFSKSQTTNGIVLAFSGVNGTNPVADSSGTATASSASINAPGVSAPTGGGYLVGLFATAVKATVTPPAGMTERVDLTQSSASFYLTSEVATQTVGSGGTGARTATATKASNNIGQLLLLRPK